MDPEPDFRPRSPGPARLEGKVAIVTGGDSGIERAVAILFAREDAKAVVMYLEEERDAQETMALIEAEGAQGLSIRGDIGDTAFCEEAVRRTIDRVGRIDVLIDNAAEQHPKDDLTEISEDQLERTFRTNIIGYVFMTQAALPHMKEEAAIVNTTSVTAYRGSSQLLDYSSTKGAIVAFTRALSGNLAEKGIRVDGVPPGPIWTPLIPDLSARQGGELRLERADEAGRPAERGGRLPPVPRLRGFLLHDRPGAAPQQRRDHRRLSGMDSTGQNMRKGAATAETGRMAARKLRTGFWLAAVLVGLSPAFAAELSMEAVNGAEYEEGAALRQGQSPLVLKAQVLLDRAKASPGVIDGYLGENVGKAIRAFETMQGLKSDGQLDADVWAKLGEVSGGEALVEYAISEDDVDGPFVDDIPEDYAEKAEMECQCYTSPAELLAEKFHMDIDLLKQLNRGADFGKAGTTILVANIEGGGEPGDVARIEADKRLAQLRGYDADGKLVVAYPATIGSAQLPSPSGTHQVKAIAVDAAYYYRPDVNFQQGDNTEPLTIPPGPNNPVGSVWIDLSEPTYGIHGTPEPEKIDKTHSHGCVRLTNWDVEELARLVDPGVPVEFIE